MKEIRSLIENNEILLACIAMQELDVSSLKPAYFQYLRGYAIQWISSEEQEVAERASVVVVEFLSYDDLAFFGYMMPHEFPVVNWNLFSALLIHGRFKTLERLKEFLGSKFILEHRVKSEMANISIQDGVLWLPPLLTPIKGYGKQD